MAVDTLPGMRGILWAGGLLVLAQGMPLSLLSGQTDRYFAWTIDTPITAAFLGAGYWASAVLELVAARQASWTQARVAVPSVLVFTTVTLLVTLVHLDRFHLHAADPLTRALTWGWLLVYAVVPPILTVAWWKQTRTVRIGPGPRGPAARLLPASVSPTLPAAVRHALGLQGLILGGLGVLLLVRPSEGAGFWPWPLTTLTAQAVGSWLLGLSVLTLQLWRDDNLAAAAPAFWACLTLGVLQLAVLARFFDTAMWGQATGPCYVAFVASLAMVGLAGAVAARRLNPVRHRPDSRF